MSGAGVCVLSVSGREIPKDENRPKRRFSSEPGRIRTYDHRIKSPGDTCHFSASHVYTGMAMTSEEGNNLQTPCAGGCVEAQPCKGNLCAERVQALPELPPGYRWRRRRVLGWGRAPVGIQAAVAWACWEGGEP